MNARIEMVTAKSVSVNTAISVVNARIDQPEHLAKPRRIGDPLGTEWEMRLAALQFLDDLIAATRRPGTGPRMGHVGWHDLGRGVHARGAD